MCTKFRVPTLSQRGDLFSELHHNYIMISEFGFATWDVMGCNLVLLYTWDVMIVDHIYKQGGPHADCNRAAA